MVILQNLYRDDFTLDEFSCDFPVLHQYLSILFPKASLRLISTRVS